MEIFKADMNIDFVGKSKYAFILSMLLIVLTLFSILFHKGINLGIDFAGGTLVEVKFAKKDISIDDVRDALKEIGLGSSIIQRFGEEDILIKTELSEAGKIGDRIQSALEDKFSKDSFTIQRVEMVGPAAGEALKLKGENALLYSIIGMIIYISYRFQNRIAIPIIAVALITWMLSTTSWISVTALSIASLVATIAACIWFNFRQALAAIIALIHDAVITLGFLSVTNKEFTLPVLAAILTIIGYSINDTIVVFDRIRENLSKRKDMPLRELINKSINETMSRTIITSGLTLLAVLSIFIFGGAVIHDFAFALLVGVIIGTYSSIYIASPILITWENVAQKRKKEEILRRRKR
ncbi:MAG: protein translocase subunit SecF [Candidatus Schekmanbacteria bacterium]|nr:MAG: protein translocase subunit SecF [Candidatus Schekmanbacteria bacterium]